MQKFYSTAEARLKKGGPIISILWYISDHQIEASWSDNGLTKISVYNADELEFIDEQFIPEFGEQ